METISNNTTTVNFESLFAKSKALEAQAYEVQRAATETCNMIQMQIMKEAELRVIELNKQAAELMMIAVSMLPKK